MKSIPRQALLSLCLVSTFACGVFLQGCMSFLANHPKFSWVQDSSQHFRYYIQKSLWSQSRIDSIKIQAEMDFTLIMQKLGEKKYPHTIHFFVVSDYQEIAKLSFDGVEIIMGDTLGLSFFFDNQVVISYQQQGYSHSKHQLVKVIANNLYGACHVMMNEGFGLYMNNSYKGYDLHELAAYLQRNQQPLFTMVSLSTASGFPQVGSLFKYIAENYGLRYFYELCRFDGTTTYNLNDIIWEWRTMLKEKYSPAPGQDTIRFPLRH
jgi:hypothetical protein